MKFDKLCTISPYSKFAVIIFLIILIIICGVSIKIIQNIHVITDYF